MHAKNKLYAECVRIPARRKALTVTVPETILREIREVSLVLGKGGEVAGDDSLTPGGLVIGRPNVSRVLRGRGVEKESLKLVFVIHEQLDHRQAILFQTSSSLGE